MKTVKEVIEQMDKSQIWELGESAHLAGRHYYMNRMKDFAAEIEKICRMVKEAQEPVKADDLTTALASFKKIRIIGPKNQFIIEPVADGQYKYYSRCISDTHYTSLMHLHYCISSWDRFAGNHLKLYDFESDSWTIIHL